MQWHMHTHANLCFFLILIWSSIIWVLLISFMCTSEAPKWLFNIHFMFVAVVLKYFMVIPCSQIARFKCGGSPSQCHSIPTTIWTHTCTYTYVIIIKTTFKTNIHIFIFFLFRFKEYIAIPWNNNCHKIKS